MPKKLTWWQGGLLMALLLLFTFSVFGADRPIGASTYVPYLGALLFGLSPDQYPYVKEIQNPGSWEALFLIGVFSGAFFTAVFVTKTFRLSFVPTLWKARKNNSVKSRLIWSFVSGFLMIIGARLAGGCTSGHFMSGMSQIALSSMIFGAVVLSSLIITGKLFYNKKEL